MAFFVINLKSNVIQHVEYYSNISTKYDKFLGENMKSTGVVRKVDALGRIVLPIEIRNNMDIANGDPVEIFVDDDKVILKKYRPSCIFCDNADGVTYFRGKLICKKCLEEIKKD